MSINMNFKQFRATMVDQRRRLRKMVDQVDDEMFEQLRDVYLPQLVEDVQNAVPILTGNLAEHGITYKLTRTRKNTVTLTVSARAYNKSYNYAYIQHENVNFSHEHGTHHYISGPFEKMLLDIADVEGFGYAPPVDIGSIFGGAADYEEWAEGVEGE